MLNQGWCYQDIVSPSQAGQTLLDYYTQAYGHSSREVWRSRILAGQIQVNQQIVAPDYHLEAQQVLTYQRSPWEEPVVPLKFEVLYEDLDLWVINKPSGLPVLPGGQFLENTLLFQLKKRYPQEQPVPLHRLGRGTSGLMLIARSPLARSGLSQAFREHRLSKIYRALIGPSDLPTDFTITQNIGKIPHPHLGYVYGATANGKTAISRVKVLQKNDQDTLLEVDILTGRPHQIRIHLASIGFPLYGDPLYLPGGQALVSPDPQRQPLVSDLGYYLHAYQLHFDHPRHSQKLTFTAPPPPLLT